MAGRQIPRWAFLAALVTGFAIQAAVFGTVTLQDRAGFALGRAAMALSFYVFPYNLFFWAAGGEADRVVGLGSVMLAGALMYALFARLAPPRLTLYQAGLALAAWLGLGFLLLAVFLIIGR